MLPVLPAAPTGGAAHLPNAPAPATTGQGTPPGATGVAVAAAGAMPLLGAQAVGPAQAVRAGVGRDGHGPAEVDPLAPPPDPPPLAGLGIPPLDTARVGDLDKTEDFRVLRCALDPAPAPRLDLRR